MELCTKGLGSSVNQLKQRGVSLSCVRTCVVVAEERPRINLTTSFSKLFSALGLSPRAVSTSFGCRVNIAICLQVSDDLCFCIIGERLWIHFGYLYLREHPVQNHLVYMSIYELYVTIAYLWWNAVVHTRSVYSSLVNYYPALKWSSLIRKQKASAVILIWERWGRLEKSNVYRWDWHFMYNVHVNFRSGCKHHIMRAAISACTAKLTNITSNLVTGTTNEVYARTGYLGFLRRTESAATSQNQIISEATDVSSVLRAARDLSIVSNNSFEGSGMEERSFVKTNNFTGVFP